MNLRSFLGPNDTFHLFSSWPLGPGPKRQLMWFGAGCYNGNSVPPAQQKWARQPVKTGFWRYFGYKSKNAIPTVSEAPGKWPKTLEVFWMNLHCRANGGPSMNQSGKSQRVKRPKFWCHRSRQLGLPTLSSNNSCSKPRNPFILYILGNFQDFSLHMVVPRLCVATSKPGVICPKALW